MNFFAGVQDSNTLDCLPFSEPTLAQAEALGLPSGERQRVTKDLSEQQSTVLRIKIQAEQSAKTEEEERSLPSACVKVQKD